MHLRMKWDILLFVCLFLLISANSKKSKVIDKDDYPLFIIAGTQKSGTTILSGLLAEHPLISFSKKKELHFFDKDSNYNKGIRHYLKNFSPSEKSEYIAESTPFYLAHREACQRIADVFPDVKMIILLREPVERAYSEYQMKLRRVSKQKELFDMIDEDALSIRSCLLNTDVDSLNNASCLPQQILRHATFKKVILGLQKATKKQSTYQEAVERCFVEEPNTTDKPTLFIPDHPCEVLPQWMRNRCKCTTASISQGFVWMKGTSLRSVVEEREYFNMTLLRPFFERKIMQFNPKSCFQNHPSGFEKVKPIKVALLEEATDFDQCASLNKSTSDLPLSIDDLDESTPEDVLDASLDWALEKLEEVDDAIEHCLTVRGGISSQYFYRSMYAVQLFNCFQSIDPNQFLFIPSGDMKRSLPAVLKRVLSFLELPVDRNWIRNISAQTEQVVSNRYKGNHLFICRRDVLCSLT